MAEFDSGEFRRSQPAVAAQLGPADGGQAGGVDVGLAVAGQSGLGANRDPQLAGAEGLC